MSCRPILQISGLFQVMLMLVRQKGQKLKVLEKGLTVLCVIRGNNLYVNFLQTADPFAMQSNAKVKQCKARAITIQRLILYQHL